VPIARRCAGCADEEIDRRPTALDDAVQLSNREPGPGCRPLECVEVRSGQDEAPTSDALRAYAAHRGANYVVLDTFAVYDEPADESVLTRARLFRCPAFITATY
jgi:hypothetical protein